MEPSRAERLDLLLEELARVREEVASSRNLTIKTDNLIKNLSAELKVIARDRTQQQRKFVFNSAVAYVIFVALIGGGLWFVFHARLDTVRAEQRLQENKEKTLQLQITELSAQLGRWKQIERDLLEFERVIKEGKQEQAVAAYNALKRLRFSGLLEQLVARIRKDVAQQELKRGLEFYEQGNFAKADEALVKSLEYDGQPRYLAKLLFHQGMCAVRLKDYRKGSEKLREALGRDLEKAHAPEATYHLALCHDRMDEKRTARDLYHRFFKRYSRHRLARRAKRRHEQLAEK